MSDAHTLRIAGYCRISVDEELDRDNTSIENQKAIISDFVTRKFPGSELVFYEDRDRSGYTFEQREGYQAMRRELVARLRRPARGNPVRPNDAAQKQAPAAPSYHSRRRHRFISITTAAHPVQNRPEFCPYAAASLPRRTPLVMSAIFGGGHVKCV